MSTVLKKLRVQSHEIGEDCQCKLQCFQKFTERERLENIKQFNLLEDWNQQSSYLSSLMLITPIMRRRSRKQAEEAQFRDCNYQYRVKVNRDNEVVEIRVCGKAFMSLHGITKRRLMTIQKALKLTGTSPTDKRGIHENRPWKLNAEKSSAIYDHINSFKGPSNYYRNNVPEGLSIKKMYDMYTEKYPNLPVSYETYRSIFHSKLNIPLDYPRSHDSSFDAPFSVDFLYARELAKFYSGSCSSYE